MPHWLGLLVSYILPSLVMADAITDMVDKLVVPLVADLRTIAFALLGLEAALAGLAWAGASFVGQHLVQRAKEGLMAAFIGTAIVAASAQIGTMVTGALGGK